MNYIDITGQKFGRLTVIKRVTPVGVQPIESLCQCECGKKVVVRNSQIKNGTTKSCGCLQKELISKRQKKYNKYDLSGEYGIGYTNKNEPFYFDIADYDLIKEYCWFINNRGYVYAKTLNGDGKHILFHRLIMPDSIQVDHINRIRHDNRRINLRSANNQINMLNKSKYKNNKSGTTGVTWHKRDKIWEVHIRYHNRQIYLGRYADYNEAVKVRKEAEKKYFGDYNYDNSNRKDVI